MVSLLDRNGFSKLISGFQLDTEPEIYTTNSRYILANMNQMRYNIEYHLAMSEVLDSPDIDRIEDLHLKYIIGGKIARDNRYIMPLTQLEKLLQHK